MASLPARRPRPHRVKQSFKQRHLVKRFRPPFSALTIDGGTANLALGITLSSTEDTDVTVNFAITIAMNADIGVTQLFGATEKHRSPINPSTEGHRA